MAMINPLRAETDELQAHASALQRYFRKRVPATEVDDLVQEVFLSLQSRRAHQPIENIESYLFAVAGHVLLRYRSHARRAGTHFEAMGEDNVHAASDPSPERVLSSHEELSRLVAALDALPSRTRDVFVLHRFEEMTYSAIAKSQHISVSAVEKQIMNALRLLKAHLETGR
jgi:RNA polymerase sigma-70 factor (ECF subfamily)